MNAIRSYSKIFNLGHKAVADLFNEEVVVEEKIDGSQFSFMKDQDGQVHFRSRRVEVHPGEAGMFEPGVQAVLARSDILTTGAVYRSEFLGKPKHNVLAYSRIPPDHVMIYDVDTGDQSYLSPAEKAKCAARICFECVPVLHVGMVEGLYAMDSLMDRTSVLGGAKVEGLVFKNYHRIHEQTGKTLMGKHVAEHFKEVKDSEWRKANPNKADMILHLGEKFRSEARWHKAVQHMRDDGRLTDSHQDIGPLMKEVRSDIMEECGAEISEALFKWAWKKVGRMVVAGLPEWYKDQLVKKQFA